MIEQPMRLPHIQLMTRHDCCLCDDASAVLAVASEQQRCTWEAVHVDHDKALMVRFGMDVPVLLESGNIIFKHRVTAEQLVDYLDGQADTAAKKGMLI